MITEVIELGSYALMACVLVAVALSMDSPRRSKGNFGVGGAMVLLPLIMLCAPVLLLLEGEDDE